MNIYEFVEARLREDAETAADREWAALRHWVDKQWPTVHQHDTCEDDGCVTMRTLADVWKGHPDYDPEWSNT